MSIRVLLTTLEDYLLAKKDALAGCSDDKALNEARKRFAQALNEYIDWRTDGVLEERKRRLSTVAQNTQFADMVTSKSDGQIAALSALNSAPIPYSGKSEAEFKQWAKAYEQWYNTLRKEGMNKLS